jgi:hypothetical protein
LITPSICFFLKRMMWRFTYSMNLFLITTATIATTIFLSLGGQRKWGGNSGGGNQEQIHEISEWSHHSFQEEAYVRHDQNLFSRKMEQSCDDMTICGNSIVVKVENMKLLHWMIFPRQTEYNHMVILVLLYHLKVIKVIHILPNFFLYATWVLYIYIYQSNPNISFYYKTTINYNETSTNSSYDYITNKYNHKEALDCLITFLEEIEIAMMNVLVKIMICLPCGD